MSELFGEFQEFRKILCICPSCGRIHRVSDMRLIVKGRGEKTWLDDYERKEQKLSVKEQNLDEKEDELRKAAHEKGRKEAVNKAVCPAIRALKLDPFDVKPILHPIDFVVFKGMNKTETVSDIIFLSREYKCQPLNLIRDQVKSVVSKGDYDFQLAKVDEKGRILFT
jgi:predicted Holliday junction resolvase-like endonuclease